MPEENEENLGRVNTRSHDFDAHAEVSGDGRVNVNVRLRGQAARFNKYRERRSRGPRLGADLTRNNRKYETEFQSILGKYSGTPPLNIAVHVVGSRGDVQPFIAIGKVLAVPPYSHRVRICTHPVFKDFVEENGLEFFSIGGDPAMLMAYMVKNPGLMPGYESLKAGDVRKQRTAMAQILEGCWRSCIEPGNGMDEMEASRELTIEEETERFFVADAIIANPPSYGHIHCAEKLGIPLHMMFTMPWSPTQYFPHPLASMDRDESDPHFANYISYTMMELLAWQGLGDVINGFRIKTLHLDPISPLWGHMLLSRMKVPFTYLWSPTLIPKPLDWGSHININGFSFLNQASSYTPRDDLIEFLKAGPPPVYIGFGSIVVDRPDELTKIIFGAVKRVGVRALVSKGWGGLGEGEVPEGIYLIGNCPHDWLFNHVSCVVHHGGAGTTAIGIAMGKPTVVVPFFGDQPFWGAMVFKAGAGPEPIPFKKMTEESLAHSITTALAPEIQTSVKVMSERVAGEQGAEEAAASFQASINVDTMRCLLLPDRVAVWRVRRTKIRLSTLAAAILLDHGLLILSQLKLLRHRDWYVDEGAGDPILGAIAVASGTMASAITNIVEYSRGMHQSLVSKSPESKNSGGDSISDEPPYLAQSNSLDYVPSRNPVQKAKRYSPRHLESIAYMMASDSLSKRADSTKPRNISSWSPAKKPSARSTTSSTNQQPHQNGRIHDATVETRHFAHMMAITGWKVPVAFFYNLANGFHNAPSFLYNDVTVRRRDNISGFRSGVKTAGKELILGFFDAFTGIVRLPYLGAQKKGVLGFSKGIAKGVGGLVLKPGAAVFGVPGYTLKGIEKQLEKRHDRPLKARLLVVRMKQGIVGFDKGNEEEKSLVVKRWKELVLGREYEVVASCIRGEGVEECVEHLSDHV